MQLVAKTLANQPSIRFPLVSEVGSGMVHGPTRDHKMLLLGHLGKTLSVFTMRFQRGTTWVLDLLESSYNHTDKSSSGIEPNPLHVE